MIVKLLGTEAEVEWISSKQENSIVSNDLINYIGVWFKLKEAVGSTIGFGVVLTPAEYTTETFEKAAIAAGETELRNIIAQDAKRKADREKRQNEKKTLSKLVEELGARVGIRVLGD